MKHRVPSLLIACCLPCLQVGAATFYLPGNAALPLPPMPPLPASKPAARAPLLAPRQARSANQAMLLGPNTNRVDYILAIKVVGKTVQRWHGTTWATNVASFTYLDITNTPSAPRSQVAISWESPVVLQTSDTPDFTAPGQLPVTGTTTVNLPIDAPQKFFRVPLPDTTARVAWLASADPNAIGSNLYVGTNSANYPVTLNLGTNTTWIVSGLQPGQVYYFAATAYDNDGGESPFSNEVSYLVPIFEITPNLRIK